MTVRKAFSTLALLGLLALAGCASGGSTGQTPTPTPPPTPPPTATPTPRPSALELTYLGGDGNVWEMAWPQGTPKQFTTDAQADQVRYSGLAWSPDGTQLAVLRETGSLGSPTSDKLLLFSPTGQALAHFTLSGAPYNTPFAWSPDGTLIAYRTTTNQYDPNTGDGKGRLTIISAQTGATKETLLYNAGGGGCGGAFPPLENAVMGAHYAYLGVDTFTWGPHQKSILLSRGCGNDGAGLVDLGTKQTIAGYPEGARYQPGGNLVILGVWNKNGTLSLGLGDATGTEQKVLHNETVTQSGPAYNILLGEAVWSSDGHTIYAEHDNGIWRIVPDSSNVQQVVAGAPNDSQDQATVAMAPRLSPDGSLLLYLQLQGANGQPGSGSVTSQCYVAHADGSNATPLPQGSTEAVWRPVK
jgi:Tol biopolymer transport system component